jgi:hypothetical protein
MTQHVIGIIAILFLVSCENKPTFNQEIFTSDIDNYWTAYDKIVATDDPTLQYQYINELYIDKGSTGLKHIMAAKDYTAKEYVEAIHEYPKFWSSIRENTYKSKAYDSRITKSIQKLKHLYPDLEPVPIYFTIGSFRTGGTILDKNVLIGSELTLADKSTIIDELPEWRKPFFVDYNPIEGVELLCTHEYVHTQQAPLVDNLLTYCLCEGVAEFVSTKALDVPSNTPAIQFGKDNEGLVKAKFEEDMFISQYTYNWIWGENQNELKVRDLGYYIGYSICENYYDQAGNKQEAIKKMVELDFSKKWQVEDFVDASSFLSDSLYLLYEKYEAGRPIVLSIDPAINNRLDVSSKLKAITLNFSTAMNKESRGFDFGPLGEQHVLKVQRVIGFSADGRSFTFEVELEPNQHYQSLITNRFTSVDGAPLKPLLIDFKTDKN